MKRLEIFLATVIFLTVFASSGSGQEFYKNKTIRIVVGFLAWRWNGHLRAGNRTASGEKYSRKATVIVENMPGAGSLIAANYLYKQAKPDGLTIGSWIGGLIFHQIVGREKELNLMRATLNGWIAGRRQLIVRGHQDKRRHQHRPVVHS